MNREPSFGMIVKERRQALGLTQTELGRRAGCAAITIRKIEADALRPSVQVAENLALALNIPEAEQPAFVRLARDEHRPSPIPTPPPMLEEIGGEDLTGRAVRGFQLAERIGAGGYGAVYRAIQTAVEREVAVKIILPRYADRPEFIRRFEAEAQLVARLEHPHIVPLYDYWREPGVAYLVMRYLRGGSLETRLRQGPLSPETLLPLLEQVCAGLHAAHRAGVVHRDIKPANVLIDDDGNAYLADFGIAKSLDNHNGALTQGEVVIGSPAYISPEQILSDPVKPQTDIYSLGVMLYELLTGRKPFAGPTPVAYIQQHLNQPLPLLAEQTTPTALDIVIGRATAKDPRDRYPDILTLLADLRQAFRPDASPADLVAAGDVTPPHVAAMLTLPDLANPFKGLRPFNEADAADFFGRDTLVQTLLEHLGESTDLARFLAVVGPSGSGKSSAVRAGLIPALRHGGLPNSEKWFITEMLPSAHPLDELEAALLRVAVNPPDTLREQLRADERGLLRAVNRILPPDDNTDLVLLIDQFEELFTLVDDEKTRAHFLDSIVTAVLDPGSRLRVVITLRADFIDRPLQYVDFGELLRHRTEFVLPLIPDELEQAITGPARRAGLAPETGLTSAIVSDIGDQPGMLPLLQYALTELFERREGRKLTLSAYRTSGGVSGALARRADELYAGLNDAGRQAIRRLFLRLVTIGENTEDTRRRVLQTEIASLTADGRPPTTEDPGVKQSAVLNDMIVQFGKHRLLTFDRDPVTRGPTIEVAHEALIREWARLRGWLVEDREFLLWGQRLRAALHQWETSGRDEGALLRGAPLTEAEGWFTRRQTDLSQTEQDFIRAGLDLREQRAEEREQQRQRELEAAQKLAQTERRAAGRLRQRAVWLAGAMVIAAVLAVVAVIFGQNARTQESIAVSEAEQRAAAEAEALQRRDEALVQAGIGLASQAVLELQGSSPERSVLLALEALENYPYTWQAERALSQAVIESRLRKIFRHKAWVKMALWSADETRILTASDDGTAKVWDAATGEEILTLSGHTDQVWSAYWSADNLHILTGSADGTAKVWDATTGQEILTLSGHEAGVRVRWSPDEGRIATASRDGTAGIWDAITGEKLLTLTGHEGEVSMAAWSADGKRIVTAGEDGTARIWDTKTGEELLMMAHPDWVNMLEWSPDEKRILTAADDGIARIWDAKTGKELSTLEGHSAWLPMATWSPDGSRVATVSYDGTAKIWNAETGKEVFTFTEHDTQVVWAAWSTDGKWIVTGATDGTARIWDPETGEQKLVLFGHAGEVGWAIWSADGSHILTAGDDGTAKMWDVNLTLFDFKVNNPGYAGATLPTWSPDGDRIAAGFGNGMIKVWSLITGKEVLSMQKYDTIVNHVAWSPDGRRILTVNFNTNDLVVVIWDADTGEERLTLSGHTDSPFMAKWSPDGKRIVSTSFDGTAKVWDAETGRELLTFTGHKAGTWGTDWSPDGKLIATTDWEGSARIWNADTGQELKNLYPEDYGIEIPAVAWSPDGQRLVTYAHDGVGKIWDVNTGAEILTFHGSTGWHIIWSKTGKQIVLGGGDNIVRVWDADTGAEIRRYDVGGASLANWSPDETQIAAHIGDEIKIYPAWAGKEDLINYAHQCCVVRELTVAERTQFGLPVKTNE